MSVFGPPPVGRRRLDVRTLVTRLLTLSSLRQYWGALLPLLAVLGVRGGFRSAGLVAIVVAVLVFAVGGAVVEWLRTSYGVQDGRLVVERGLLRRSLTVVPLDRIRGVDVHASALQRLLGIVSVRVDAAATGGKEDEAVLDSVSAVEGSMLRDLLLREVPVHPAGPAPGPIGAAPGAPVPAPAPPQLLARFEPRWLLYAPLVGGYLLAPLAAFGALANLADDVRLPLHLRRWLQDALGERPGLLLLAGVAAVVIVLSVIGAVITAAVANWGFTLTRRGGTLVAERGLLSRRQVSLEHDRIRGYALAEPLALRAVGAARLTALVTGLGGGDDEGGTGRRGQLLPLGPATVARSVAAAAVTRFDPPLRRHPAAARRRRLVRAVLPWLVPAALFGAFRLWPGLAVCLGLALIGIPLALDRYAGLGNAVDARSVSVRSGSLRRRQVVLARRGVVGATVRQTFFQRRAGLATVTVATGAGSGGYAAIDIGAADAVRLLREVDPVRMAPLSTLVP
ncbi:MAG TPA: PH domain-containing protein [Mycobacteriales bacterium]|nr:PH domain-containing protein [Mycobacteriales bacterium]